MNGKFSGQLSLFTDYSLQTTVSTRKVNKTAELSQRRPRDAPNIWVR